jgi:hypothetical protein
MYHMKTLSTGAFLASALALGFAASPASTDSDRTDCLGNNCVRVHCYDDSDTCTRTTNFSVNGQISHWVDQNGRTSYVTESFSEPRAKPQRYACDIDGVNCHWTSSYYYNEFDEPVYDRDVAP